jgi:hypothetical protein
MEQTKVKMISTVWVVTLTSAMAVVGCASFERTHSSGYAHRYGGSGVSAADDRESFRREVAMNELGALGSEESIRTRKLLKRYESDLEGKSEREQYYNAKPLLSSDAERIRFLSLGATDKRERYLEERGLASESVQHPPQVQQLVEENDIAAGMTKQAVRDSWGAPDEVLVAGNPMYGNEKWMYREQMTSSEGYMTETRVVYFEGGLVVGWSTK